MAAEGLVVAPGALVVSVFLEGFLLCLMFVVMVLVMRLLRVRLLSRLRLVMLMMRVPFFDVDAIAEKVLGGYEHGFSCVVDADTFWEIVACHAL